MLAHISFFVFALIFWRRSRVPCSCHGENNPHASPAFIFHLFGWSLKSRTTPRIAVFLSRYLVPSL